MHYSSPSRLFLVSNSALATLLLLVLRHQRNSKDYAITTDLSAHASPRGGSGCRPRLPFEAALAKARTHSWFYENCKTRILLLHSGQQSPRAQPDVDARHTLYSCVSQKQQPANISTTSSQRASFMPLLSSTFHGFSPPEQRSQLA